MFVWGCEGVNGLQGIGDRALKWASALQGILLAPAQIMTHSLTRLQEGLERCVLNGF